MNSHQIECVYAPLNNNVTIYYIRMLLEMPIHISTNSAWRAEIRDLNKNNHRIFFLLF